MRRVVVLFASAALAVSLGSVSPSLVTATQQKSGTISCSASARHSFLTVRYSDWVGAWAPGISTPYYYGYYDGLMHVYEGQGRDYGGSWKAQANPLLDFQYTYAFCSSQI
jgi:hypothetical protein